MSDGLSNHQPYGCLLNRLFKAQIKETTNSASLAFVRGIYWWPVNSPHKGPVTQKMFPFDDIIMWPGSPRYTSLSIWGVKSGLTLWSLYGERSQEMIIEKLFRFNYLYCNHSYHGTGKKQDKMTFQKCHPPLMTTSQLQIYKCETIFILFIIHGNQKHWNQLYITLK